MKPYTLELRQRIVEAMDKQIGTVDEIASIFNVHSSYVYKLNEMALTRKKSPGGQVKRIR